MYVCMYVCACVDVLMCEWVYVHTHMNACVHVHKNVEVHMHENLQIPC